MFFNVISCAVLVPCSVSRLSMTSRLTRFSSAGYFFFLGARGHKTAIYDLAPNPDAVASTFLLRLHGAVVGDRFPPNTPKYAMWRAGATHESKVVAVTMISVRRTL